MGSYKIYGKNSPFYMLTFGEYGLAYSTGFNQIPRGGSQDSSSYRRPNFEELHIHKEFFHSLGIGAQYYSWQIRYSHAAIHLESSAMLNQSLFSHGLSLPAEMLYHFNIALNKHQIQFEKAFSIAAIKNNVHLSLLSNIDWLGYHYHFYPLSTQSAISAPASQRDFINLSCSLGMTFQYRWSSYFSSAVYLSTSLPFFHLQIAEAKLIQRFHLIDKSLLKLTPYVGIAYSKMDLQDNQGLANHLLFTAKPYIFAGVEFLFI